MDALKTLDGMLVKSGLTLTSNNATSSNAAAIKATPTGHYDVTALQEVADMIGLTAKDLNALSGNQHVMDMVNSGLDALSGIVSESPEALKDIKDAGERVQRNFDELEGFKEDEALSSTDSGSQQPMNNESFYFPTRGNSSDSLKHDSILVTIHRQVGLYRGIEHIPATTADTSNKYLWRPIQGGGMRIDSIISVKPIK